MTPEERAKKLIAFVRGCASSNGSCEVCDLTALIHIREAIAEEKERCKQVALRYVGLDIGSNFDKITAECIAKEIGK